MSLEARVCSTITVAVRDWAFIVASPEPLQDMRGVSTMSAPLAPAPRRQCIASCCRDFDGHQADRAFRERFRAIWAAGRPAGETLRTLLSSLGEIDLTALLAMMSLWRYRLIAEVASDQHVRRS